MHEKSIVVKNFMQPSRQNKEGMNCLFHVEPNKKSHPQHRPLCGMVAVWWL